MLVFSNSAVSVDGRVGDASGSRSTPGSALDLAYMSVLRARADAVLIGGATFRRWGLPLVPSESAIDRLRALSPAERDGLDIEVPALQGRQWWNVVLTRTLDVPDSGRFYADLRCRPLFLTSAPGPAPGEVERAAEVTVPWVLEQLARRGVERLLIEGGPGILAAFLRAGVLDTMYVTVCPRLYGAGLPLVEGPDLQASLRLRAAHVVGEHIFTRYDVFRGG